MVEEMDPADLQVRLDAEADVQVVDIRSERQFRRGHIPGADNLPFPSLPRRIDEVNWGEEVVVVCPKGKSSKQAARLIESYEGLPEGARVHNLTGGYREWEGELAADGADAAGDDPDADEGPAAPF